MGQQARQARQGLQLSDLERRVLVATARRRLASAADVTRARIILGCAAGDPIPVIADSVGVTSATVRKWRARFQMSGLAGLRDQPRSGRPRSRTEDVLMDVVRHMIWVEPPLGAEVWATRSLAHELGLSQSAVSRALRETGTTREIAATCRALGLSGFWSRSVQLRGLVLNDANAAAAIEVTGVGRDFRADQRWLRDVQSSIANGENGVSSADELDAWAEQVGATHLVVCGSYIPASVKLADRGIATIPFPRLPWWRVAVTPMT